MPEARVWYRLHAWLSALFRRGAEERALREEIAFHLEQEREWQLRRGASPREAERLTAVRFGDIDRVRDATREARGLHPTEGIMQDLRHAIRGLLRTRAYTQVALITLALGLGATTVAFTLVDRVLLQPLPYHDADALMFIRERTEDGGLLPPSFPNFTDWRAQSRAFSAVASVQYPYAQTVQGAGEPLRATTMGVSRDFFETLGVRPVLGRTFRPEESRAETFTSVVVSYEFWQSQLGGNRDLASISLRAWGHPVQVIGVMPPGFRFLQDASIYFPHEVWPGTVRSSHNFEVIGRLAPGRTLADARTDMTRISQVLRREYGTETQAVDADVMPLREYVVGRQRRLLYLLLGASVLVLLVACTNVTTMQLAHGTARTRELAVRVALGARRWRLVRQLLVESSVLGGAGLLLGLGLAFALLRAIRTVGKGMIPRLQEVQPDGRVFLFALLLLALTVLLTGAYPAVRGSARALRALRSRTNASGFEGRSPVWRFLIGFEIALAVLLVIGSGLLLRTMQSIVSRDPGFDPHNVVTVALGATIEPAQLERMETDLRAIPGVTAVGSGSMLPMNWGSVAGPVLRPGDARDHWPALAGFRVITPDYFSTLRQTVLRGRTFTPADRAGTPPVAVITQPLAERLWPGQDAIGQRVRTNYLSEEWLTVVGVVPEASNWADDGPQHEIYVPWAQAGDKAYALYMLVRTTASPRSVFDALRTHLHTTAPGIPVDFGTMEERVVRSASDRRFAMIVLSAFGLIALLLAAAGIYGVLSYSVEVRRREIGIRVALGASPARVQRGIVRGATWVAVAGIALGLLSGTVATRALQTLLYGVQRLDGLSFAAAAAVLLGTALLAAWLPARRSSRVDPLTAMRAE